MQQISKEAVRLLRWMRKHSDSYLFFFELERRYGHEIDHELIRHLSDDVKYLTKDIDEDDLSRDNDMDDHVAITRYRISDAGRAYLQSLQTVALSEVRNWASLVIALLAFIKSFFF